MQCGCIAVVSAHVSLGAQRLPTQLKACTSFHLQGRHTAGGGVQDVCLFKFQHCARCDSKHSKCVACNAPFAVTPQGHCVCPIGWQAATNQFGETTCLSPGVTQLEPYVANITSQITNLTTIVQTITQARPGHVMQGGSHCGASALMVVSLRFGSVWCSAYEAHAQQGFISQGSNAGQCVSTGELH